MHFSCKLYQCVQTLIAHGPDLIECWMKYYADEIQETLLTEVLLKVKQIVMINNIFPFDNNYTGSEKCGMSMGKSSACI